MSDYAGIFKAMNAVIYFSCTGNSRKVAQNIAEKTGFKLIELTKLNYDVILSGGYGTAAVVFPVHCQSYPKFLKRFFKNLKAENVALIATYGKAHAGNAVYEAAKLVSGKITAAAYIAVGHSYLNAEADADCVPEAESVPDALTEKILSPSPVLVPKRRKTPFAGFLPSLRSRITVKIYKTQACVNCNTCGKICPLGAIECGKTNSKCVRCLKCVTACPHGALKFKKSRILSRYLKKTHFDETILYLK